MERPAPEQPHLRWITRVSTARASGWASASARSTSLLGPSPAPGKPRCASPRGSVSSPPTRTCALSWPPPWPASWPGSCGPRWWPRTEHDRPVGHGAIGAARDRALHDAPEHRRSRFDPRRRSSQSPSVQGLHGRPYSEATTCEWLYCDPDSRTSSWRFSDPPRSGASSSDSRPLSTTAPRGAG